MKYKHVLNRNESTYEYINTKEQNSFKHSSAKLEGISSEEFIGNYSKDAEFLNYLKYVKSLLNEFMMLWNKLTSNMMNIMIFHPLKGIVKNLLG